MGADVEIQEVHIENTSGGLLHVRVAGVDWEGHAAQSEIFLPVASSIDVESLEAVQLWLDLT